jgi:hypothetical protein
MLFSVWCGQCVVLAGESVNLAAGFGFNGYTSTGEPRWDMLDNVSLWDVEVISFYYVTFGKRRKFCVTHPKGGPQKSTCIKAELPHNFGISAHSCPGHPARLNKIPGSTHHMRKQALSNMGPLTGNPTLTHDTGSWTNVHHQPAKPKQSRCYTQETLLDE